MNYFLIGALCIFTIMDTILMRRYDNKIKKLTEENKNLKKLIENYGVK